MVIHIGYPKAASTSIQDWVGRSGELSLACRHDIYDHVVKEACRPKGREHAKKFFESLKNREKQKGERIVISEERLVGYPYAGCFDAYEILEILRENFDEGWKIVIVLREQFDMAWSLYKEYIRSGGYRRAVDFFFGGSSVIMIPGFDWRFFCYDELVTEYISAFGRNGVEVVPFERLKLGSFWKEMGQIFGVEEAEGEMSNIGMRDEEMERRRVENIFASENLICPAMPLHGYKVDCLRVESDDTQISKSKVKSMIASRVGLEICRSNIRLEKITKIRLRKLGYHTDVNRLLRSLDCK